MVVDGNAIRKLRGIPVHAEPPSYVLIHKHGNFVFMKVDVEPSQSFNAPYHKPWVLVTQDGDVETAGWNNTVSSDFRSHNATGPDIAAIVAPTVTLGLLAVAAAVAAWLLCVVKKKRQTEGAYRPSAEEQRGTQGMATTDVLKLPKEERLI
nr:protein crumbs homolog 3-like [Nerophis lumbriciformis]